MSTRVIPPAGAPSSTYTPWIWCRYFGECYGADSILHLAAPELVEALHIKTLCSLAMVAPSFRPTNDERNDHLGKYWMYMRSMHGVWAGNFLQIRKPASDCRCATMRHDSLLRPKGTITG
jgi:hypothetical protein